jgi:hypothetical protein
MRIVEFYQDKQSRPHVPNTGTSGLGMFLAPHSVKGVHLAGELSKTSQTDNYTATDEMVVLVDASTYPITISLPDATANPSRVYWIKKTDDSNNEVIIEGYQYDTIDGDLTLTLTLQYQYVMIISDGNDWFILGGEYVKMTDVINKVLEEAEEANDTLELIEKHLENITDLELKEDE